MRDIDKQTLTYRPNINYDIVLSQSIKEKIHVDESVMADKSDALIDSIKTHKTDLLNEYENYNPAIVIQKLLIANDLKEDLIKELETTNNLQKQLNKDFGGDDYVHSIEDPVIHDSSIAIKNLIDEIDNITELITDLLDVGKTDVEMSEHLNREYEKISDIIAKEEAQISFYTEYQLSDIERAYVDELMFDSRNKINSYDDYVDRIIQEYRERGADGVDYDAVRSDTKKSYMAQTILNETINLANRALEVHRYNMSDLFDNMVDDTLVYLVDHASRSDVKDMSNLNYRRVIRDTAVIRENMGRYNDSTFREALNKHLLEVEEVRRRYAYTREKEALEGSQPSLKIVELNNSTKSLVDSNWENVLVDRISSTKALSHQLNLLLENAMSQKEYSLMYRFADIIDREFDFEHKEKELKVFNSRNRIYSMQ